MNPTVLQLPADVATAFAQADNERIRASNKMSDRIEIAKEAPLTAAGLAASAKDKAASVRSHLVSNPWCPTETLEQLASDRSGDVARTARTELVRRRGVLTTEFASADVIERTVTGIVGHLARGQYTVTTRSALQDTARFTAAQVNEMLDACIDRTARTRTVEGLSLNRSLDPDTFAVVVDELTPMNRHDAWLRNPTTRADRLLAVVQGTVGLSDYDLIRAVAHRNADPAVALDALGRMNLEVFLSRNTAWDNHVVDAVTVRLTDVLNGTTWGSRSPYRFMRAAINNPAAPDMMIERIVELAAADGDDLKAVLAQGEGDPRVPISRYRTVQIVPWRRRAMMVTIARMCSGLPDAADTFTAALSLVDDLVGAGQTYVELVDLAAALVS